jgi:hypothetical protein
MGQEAIKHPCEDANPEPKPDDPSQTSDVADALHRRIELYCRHLHTGVPGTLAIGYLRQIADDEDDLTKLPSAAG